MRVHHQNLSSSPTTKLRGAVRLLAAAVGTGALIAGLSLVAPVTATPAEAATPVATTASVTAAAVTGYNPSELISDEVIFDTTTMTQASIQSLLNAKGANCSGALCLKNYKVTTPSKPLDSLCTPYTAVANESAAAIIYKVSQACKTNPQVLLTILQKEQSLVTTTAPTAAALSVATGYGCPDRSACDPHYAGFFMQVYAAARQLHLTPNYPVGTATTIAYNPNTSCGGATLTLKNASTAALYSYTPYAANPALLAGKADGCSIAGNVNFVKTFTSWFGNPVLTPSVKSYVISAYKDVLGRTVSTSEEARQTRSIMNGTSRDTLAFSFLSSTEYRTSFVKATYIKYIGRSASTTEAKNWVARMAAGTANQDDLPATFMAADEYYKKVGGGTDKGYVTALYATILNGQKPDAGGLQRWIEKLQAPNGRANVALGIWRSNASSKIRTNLVYQQYLGANRVARDSEQQAWATKIAKTGYYKAVAGIIASDEYLNKAVKAYPQAQ
ncbi:DUF4214 domain-containing protein [Glaciihabitans sp. dw_435]|uniref:DUF4214 domain-containing protein n=1 Tax=Glaciihabitans sp. dw_435 TaxID=2720081 RepID=UPI001BD6C292|nr:DUF4214 domain-containing protein [Glaciihabitans sp. dw_435]